MGTDANDSNDSTRDLPPIGGPPSSATGGFRRIGEHPGDWIGPYKLLEMIGEGGFGVVYLAERREPMVQRVALKIIKPGMDSKSVVARFDQERQALAVMDHPNVAKVFDGGVTPGGRPYFVMEYVQGESITAFCDRHTFTIRQRLELYIPVCEAVQHAHMKGLIHRDIKPSNVLVSVRDGSATPKVIDFGVAKAISHSLTDKTIFTETGQLIGTAEYMSPEQAEMGRLDIDTRTDVYSLGVVLYELLTGLLPFDAEELRSKGYAEIQRIIRDVEPPTPSRRLTGVDSPRASAIATSRQSEGGRIASELRKELEWIPLMAMRKDRSRRYESAAQLADDLRSYLAGRPLRAAPESKSYRVRKIVHRYRAAFVTATCVFVALLIGLFGTAYQGLAARRAEASATEKAKQAEIANGFLRRLVGLGDPITASAESSPHTSSDLPDVLQAAERSLDKTFESDPVKAQQWRAIIGQALLGIKPAERGLSLLRKAERELAKQLGENHPIAVKWRVQVMRGLAFTGRNKECLELGTQLLPIVDAGVKDLPGEDERVRAFAIGCYNPLGRFEDTIQSYLEYDKWLGAKKEPSQLLTATTSDYVLALHRTGRTSEAVEVAERNLRDTLGWAGPDHLNTLLVREQLLTLRESLPGQLSPEERLRGRQELSRDAARVFGQRHETTIHMTGRLAEELIRVGRHEDAAAVLDDNLTVRRGVFGIDHQDTFWAVETLARELKGLGREQSLLAQCRGRRDWARNFHGEKSWQFVAESVALASALRAVEDVSSAAEALQSVRPAAVALPGDRIALRRAWADRLNDVLTKEGKHDECFALLRECLSTDDGWGGGHFSLGWKFMDTGRPADAVAEFRKAITLSSYADGGLLSSLGEALSLSGFPAEGVDPLREATRVSPDWWLVWYRYGRVLRSLNRLDEAAAACAKAAELDPNGGGPWVELGDIRRSQRKFDEAQKAIDQALRVSGGWANPWWLQGLLFLDQDRPQEAVEPLVKAVALAPDWADPSMRLAAAHDRNGDALAALAAATNAARLSPRWAYPHFLKGKSFVLLDRAAEAIEPLRTANSIEPQWADHWLWLGKALEATGRHAEALVAFDRAAVLEPNRQEVAKCRTELQSSISGNQRRGYELLAQLEKLHIWKPRIAEALRTANEPPEVMEVAEAALEWLDQSAMSLNITAWHIVRDPSLAETQYAAAQAAAEAAVAAEPANDMFLNTLGVALYRMRSFDKALATLIRSSEGGRKMTGETRPEDAVFVAMTLFRLGRSSEACSQMNDLKSDLLKHPERKTPEIAGFVAEAEMLMTCN